MTLKAVNDFFETANDNSNILHELAKAMSSECFGQVVAEIGAKYGYEFTANELMQQINMCQNNPTNIDELNEEDLEGIAGGIGGNSIYGNTMASLRNVLPIISKLYSTDTHISCT
jgi:Nif11 domain